MRRIIECSKTNDLMDALKNGELSISDGADEAIQAWLSAVQQTASKMTLPRITGEISTEMFQSAFKSVKERTTSSPSGMHYLLWKSLAHEDDLSEWLSTLMSLPLMYGFVNQRWTKMVDVMIEKKPGVTKIHLLRIIGILEAGLILGLQFPTGVSKSF